MKLKEAVKEARSRGFKHIAADSDRDIYAYSEKPELQHNSSVWMSDSGGWVYVGHYNGKKEWEDTHRIIQ